MYINILFTGLPLVFVIASFGLERAYQARNIALNL